MYLSRQPDNHHRLTEHVIVRTNEHGVIERTQSMRGATAASGGGGRGAGGRRLSRQSRPARFLLLPLLEKTASDAKHTKQTS